MDIRMKKSHMKQKSRRKRTVWIVLGILVFCLIAGCLIVLPPGKGRLEPFVDEKGQPLEGSIAERVLLDSAGASLGMFLVGKDETKPVLLFLGGGPGIPEYLLEDIYPTGLEEEFVVCYLEWRGTSFSYTPGMDAASMTTQQYLEDVLTVTNYLRERFGQDKIYLMAHSFGTYIGLNMASVHPELYQAYIAMSQICNQKESEYAAYDYMRNMYEEEGNRKKVKQFDNYEIKESEEDYYAYFNAMLRDSSMHELGVGTARDMKSVITGLFFPSLRCRAYSPMERIRIWQGKMFAQKTQVAMDARNFDAFSEIQELKIPVYFLAGKYDYTCWYDLQKEYCEMLQAPEKEFYTFQNSAHSPLFEEPEKARQILTDLVFADKKS